MSAPQYRDLSTFQGRPVNPANLPSRPSLAPGHTHAQQQNPLKRKQPPGKQALSVLTSSPVANYERGSGSRVGTKVADLVRWMKEHPEVHRLEDLAIRSGVDELMTSRDLYDTFRSHDRVAWDEKTNLYRFKPDYDIRSKEDLLRLLKQYQPRGGLPVKTLRESWPNVVPAIEDLERQGKVLVTRAGTTEEKEGVLKMVFYDEIQKPEKVDREFRDLWHSLETPDEVELPRQLQAEGMRTTATAKTAAAPTQQRKKKKSSNNRRIKITNTHLKDIDLTKDYVPQK